MSCNIFVKQRFSYFLQFCLIPNFSAFSYSGGKCSSTELVGLKS